MVEWWSNVCTLYEAIVCGHPTITPTHAFWDKTSLACFPQEYALPSSAGAPDTAPPSHASRWPVLSPLRGKCWASCSTEQLQWSVHPALEDTVALGYCEDLWKWLKTVAWHPKWNEYIDIIIIIDRINFSTSNDWQIWYKERLTLIFGNSNWNRLGLVGWTNTAGNSFVLGSTCQIRTREREIRKKSASNFCSFTITNNMVFFEKPH